MQLWHKEVTNHDEPVTQVTSKDKTRRPSYLNIRIQWSNCTEQSRCSILRWFNKSIQEVKLELSALEKRVHIKRLFKTRRVYSFMFFHVFQFPLGLLPPAPGDLDFNDRFGLWTCSFLSALASDGSFDERTITNQAILWHNYWFRGWDQFTQEMSTSLPSLQTALRKFFRLTRPSVRSPALLHPISTKQNPADPTMWIPNVVFFMYSVLWNFPTRLAVQCLSINASAVENKGSILTILSVLVPLSARCSPYFHVPPDLYESNTWLQFFQSPCWPLLLLCKPKRCQDFSGSSELTVEWRTTRNILDSQWQD